MALNRSPPPTSPTRQSIPLQNLSRPPEHDQNVSHVAGHRRTASWRARELLARRSRFHGTVNIGYEPVGESHPMYTDSAAPPHVTTPRNAYQTPYEYHDGEVSPVNAADFASAMGGMGDMGLSFEPAYEPVVEPPGPSRPTAPRRRSTIPSTLNVITENYDPAGATSLGPHAFHESEPEHDVFLSPPDSDRTPLTDSRYLAPISGAQTDGTSAPRNSRLGSRLGDDLQNSERGLRTRPTSTLNTMGVSPLSRAGTIMRKVSQRVVNLSNEPDPIEHSMRPDRQEREEADDDSKESRMQAPPVLPYMPAHAHDETSTQSFEMEKLRHLASTQPVGNQWLPAPNPLKGKSLGIFGPENRLRLKLCDMLVHPATEPLILILIVIQTILLAVDAAPSIEQDSRRKSWDRSWIDFALIGLFVIYTVEIIARVIVSGFVKNPYEYSTVSFAQGRKAGLSERVKTFFGPQRQNSSRNPTNRSEPGPSIFRQFTNVQTPFDQPGHSGQAQRIRLARRAFLRHGFNRLDFVAVISFWIAIVLSPLATSVEVEKHMYIFRMLSCLRILRLLGLTSGTSVILRSLKKAAPLLVNVAFLIGFFWLLFAVVGVQAFKSSFRRSCVWFDDIDDAKNKNGTNLAPGSFYRHNATPDVFQFCGGHIANDTLQKMPWVKANLQENGTTKHKGFLCPAGSMCVEGRGPYNGTVGFDNVLQSLQMVFVIMSANTFSDIMYYTTDSDFLAAALFFAIGIVIMSFWMINLLVAVITSSFQVIREESKTSAFTADDEQYHFIEDEPQVVRSGYLKRLFDKTHWLWITIILFDLLVMCLRSSNMGPDRKAFINNTETVVTCALLVEIVLRFLSDWRNFHKSRYNWVDLGLAVITGVIQIPPIHNSGQPYAWLSIFQILRIYRVVLAISITRDLIRKVLGNVAGLVNLIVFVFLVTFLTAIFAVQIFRGEFPSQDSNNQAIHVTFSDIYNSFIGMYQILSSENWTLLMYNATQYQFQWSTSWIGATFIILWFILANFIVLNMFIAVIQENFDVSEDEKRLQQVKAFLQQKELGGSSHGNLSLATILKLGRNKAGHRDPIDYGPATMEMLLHDDLYRDWLDEAMDDDLQDDDDTVVDRPSGPLKPGLITQWWNRIISILGNGEANPFYSRVQFSRHREEVNIRTQAQQVVTLTERRRKQQRQYLQRHPRYNVSLFLFPTNSPIRRYCQCIVGPGRGGERIEGSEPYKPVWYGFSAFIYAAIVAMVILACISTPLYQKEYFDKRGGFNARNWFVWTDMGFAVIFSMEALIKVIADGFFWTPNAYFRGSWGFIDGLVLVTLWINVITSLYKDGAVSRAVGAFKALRALRLLNVSDSARDTFHSVIVLGGWKVISAAFVSLSLLFPFAIYGLNLFNGKMLDCNDNSIEYLSDCVGEFNSTPFMWNVLAPRQTANDYYSFDNFGSSLSILFQIVSQEGWTDVMWRAMSITGPDTSQGSYQSQGNAIFFIIFNLLGAVFVLTLFVSVFMRNYTEQTGVAFLTADQRSWLELRKLLKQISPSKRPSKKSEQGWRGWCYRIAVKKRGRWQRLLTFILLLHLILLVLEWYGEPPAWQRARDYIFLGFTVFYIANVVVRIVGLTWKRFRNSSWDLYSIFAVTGTVITTLLTLSRYSNNTYSMLHKFFLVSIALLLIPRNNQLDQLFKTAAASLSAIGNLLATWFVLFLAYAIALTQTLGLTRFGVNEDGNLNFRNVPKALILLFRMSCGESWNAIMEDYATITPPYCNDRSAFFESDCGSAAWARTLFISWNILSMYIFVSLFVSLIFESFSYVYQKSSGLSVVSRKEIRKFKQAWATFDPEGTGFIPRETFPRLLGELSGVFEMRIYAGGDHSHASPGARFGVDLAELNRQLRMIDVDDIRRRRRRMETFFQEILVSSDQARGVNFTSCLMILAHYNVIDDKKALRLEEYLRRRARMQRVDEEVDRRIIMSFFDMMFWFRQFRSRHDFRHSARMVNVPQFAVPEIFVDDQDALASPQGTVAGPFSDAPAVPPKDGGFPGRPSLDTSGIRHRNASPTRSPSASDRSPSISPRLSSSAGLSPSGRSPTLTPHHSPSPSAESAFNWNLSSSPDAGPAGSAFDGPSERLSPAGGRSRAHSAVDRENVLQVFDNSAWGPFAIKNGGFGVLRGFPQPPRIPNPAPKGIQVRTSPSLGYY
ncbi:uncharacterized protein KY384_002118 [Bacidia gigantensis]|uniref:uncharacterized protein n=1 Tax=Bacidia gigantensis TaxID=2732470 RepID=UPI001D04E416|nr:uncharacterized protein KY384_002118 [Bacidia gigantensis]KAG8533335.1 hypothetical protein KY384_002118 [Bacidia gigantensis]